MFLAVMAVELLHGHVEITKVSPFLILSTTPIFTLLLTCWVLGVLLAKDVLVAVLTKEVHVVLPS